MDLREFIRTATPLRALGVVVSQDGHEIARHTWEGACRRNIYSATKSFTSAAVGIAVREGLLSLDEKLTDAFAEDLPEFVRKLCPLRRLHELLGQPCSFPHIAALRGLRCTLKCCGVLKGINMLPSFDMGVFFNLLLRVQMLRRAQRRSIKLFVA